MRTWIKWMASAAVSLGLLAGAQAQDRGTKEEAVAMADAAFDHIKKVGATKAYKDFNQDKAHWTKKDLYVFVYSSKGKALAHGADPSLVGKELSQIKDAGGVPVLTKMVEVALQGQGSGWVDYDWTDPLTHKVTPKSTYVRKTPDGTAFIGVGIYR